VKTILLILGPNGVGKSTTAMMMLTKLTNSAIVDGDWCRAMNPYNIDTVVRNIYALIKNYLLCDDIETVIYPYGFHGDRKARYDMIIDMLSKDKIDFSVFPVILTCSLEENIARCKTDERDTGRIVRGIKNTHHFYSKYNYPAIDSTTMTVEQTAEKILAVYRMEVTGEQT